MQSNFGRSGCLFVSTGLIFADKLHAEIKQGLILKSPPKTRGDFKF